MSGKRIPYFFLTLCTAITLASSRPASAGDSTNGHGDFTTGGSAVTSFVFDAKITSGSAVTGRARFFEIGGVDIDIVLTCLTVSGDIAILGGTDATNSSVTYAFKVTDNGGGVTADRITLPQVNQICSTFNTLGNWALTSGDIEVHDLP